MKREFLDQFGLAKDVVEKIIAEHGKTVQAAQASIPDDYEALKEKSKTYDQTIQKLTEQLEEEKGKITSFDDEKNELLAQLEAHKSKELKIRIARENNLPFDLAGRLKGETEEELHEDAKTLASLVTKKDILPLKEVSEASTQDEAYKNMLEEL